MTDYRLNGCAPRPLASYLKSIGLFRVVATKDSQLRCSWHRDRLAIHSTLSTEQLEAFFLNDYEPTPVVAPWNGGSGFYEKDTKDALLAIQSGSANRLGVFRSTLAAVEATLKGHDRSASPKGDEKLSLLTALRSSLPDEALQWLDASVLITSENAKYPPLLGTGGNDGRLDFTNNFMQRLVDVIDPQTGEATDNSAAWLKMALHGEPTHGLCKAAIGQFSPGQVGGPNATTGYDTKGSINPWEFILMIEGAMAFAAAAVRRNAEDDQGTLAFPFTVRSTSAGSGNLAPDDSDSARAELWLPIWQQPVSWNELRSVMGEGRVALGRRPAKDGLDFVRAVHRLGSYRGIGAFQRYGLLMRSGKAFLATPLNRIEVRENPTAQLIDELEDHRGNYWLSRFRAMTRGKHTARRFIQLRHRLENHLFRISQDRPHTGQLQTTLLLLAEIQQALAISSAAREQVGPVPLLSSRWLQGADDGGAACRIAIALASLRGENEKPMPLRAQIYPVHPKRHDWMERVMKDHPTDPFGRLKWNEARGSNLNDMLIGLLTRRLWLADRLEFKDKPMSSSGGIGLDDLNQFLFDDSMDRRIAQLMPAFALIREFPALEPSVGGHHIPPAFAVLRLVMCRDAVLHRLNVLPTKARLPVPTGLIRQLATDQTHQGERAIQLAWRRLHASGLTPRISPTQLVASGSLSFRRAASALLIPISFGAAGHMTRSLLGGKSEQEDQSTHATTV
jgi:CRISPR-associated protein Csx17